MMIFVDFCINYLCVLFDEVDVVFDFFVQFDCWFKEVFVVKLFELNMMIFVIVGVDGWLLVWIVFIKGVDECGFVFFINYESCKGYDFVVYLQVVLLFYWIEFECQVCIEGWIEKISVEESDCYFVLCLFGLCIGVWVLEQSVVIDSCVMFEVCEKVVSECYGDNLLCLLYWGGYCFVFDLIEFWQGCLLWLYDCLFYMCDVVVLLGWMILCLLL